MSHILSQPDPEQLITIPLLEVVSWPKGHTDDSVWWNQIPAWPADVAGSTEGGSKSVEGGMVSSGICSSCPWHSGALEGMELSTCQAADSDYCLWLVVGQSELVFLPAGGVQWMGSCYQFMKLWEQASSLPAWYEGRQNKD